MERFTQKSKILTHTLLLLVVIFAFTHTTVAAPNYEINYQGKLTTPANVAVPDGLYNMRFWLLSTPSIATTSAVWTESLTGANRVQVTNGLFSIMLGSTSPLTSVDFNQTLYLGVEIGGTTTPSWDGEMSPRKILGTVPAAFYAETASTSLRANTLDGLDSTQFVRTDTASEIASTSANTLFTITQSGSGNIFDLYSVGDKVFTVLANGRVGIGTTTPYASGLTVDGDVALSGGLYDNTATRGTNGQILQTTGSGVRWIATSTLNISLSDTSGILGATRGGTGLSSVAQNQLLIGGAGDTWTQIATSSLGLSSAFTNSAGLAALLSDETGTGNVVFSSSPTFTGGASFAGLNVSASSTLGYASSTALTVSGNSYFNFASSSYASTTGFTAQNAYIGGTLGLGTTSPYGLGLTMDRSGVSGAATAGIAQYLQFTNSVLNTTYFGNQTNIFNEPTATSTLIGSIMRIHDNSTLGNTVRGLEVQTNRGTNTFGENTAIAGFGRTFGVRGTTDGNAGGVATPAGVFAETRGTTLGNALRAYSGNITTSSLVSLYQDNSIFTGTGLLMNFGNGTGTFSGANARFLDLQTAGVSKFVVTADGKLGIGTTSPWKALSVVGDLSLSGALFDSASTSGSNGMVLQTTGTGVQWVATSSLGISGGVADGMSNWSYNGTALTPTTTSAGILLSGSSTIQNLSMVNSTTTNATTTNLRTTRLAIGTDDAITDITGSGLTVTGNALTCATGNSITFGCLTAADWIVFNNKVSSTSIDTSAELAALLTDETGTGNVVFSSSPTFTGGASFAGLNVSASSTLGYASSTALTVSGQSFLNTFTANSGTTTNLVAASTLRIVGGTDFPTNPSEGTLFYSTASTSLYVYEQGKWQADRSTASYIVAASNTQNKEKADYVATGVNDQDTIEQALAALPSTGGLVYLLPGTYNINNEINITQSSTTLMGSGPSTVLAITATSTSWDIIDILGTSYITIADIAIDGGAALAGSQKGIYFQSSASSTVSGVTIRNTRNDGVAISASRDVTITDSIINRAGENAVWVGSSQRTRIINNHITDAVDSGVNNDTSNYTIIANNHITETDLNGIRSDSSQSVTISGNTLLANASYGIYVTYGTNFVIDGNQLYDNNGATANSSIVLEFSSRNTIANNRIEDTAGTGYAIDIGNSASSDNIIANNYYNGVGAESIRDLGTRTKYTQWDRLTLNTPTSRAYSIFALNASSSSSTAEIRQQGTGSILDLYNSSSRVLTVTNAGNLGLGTTTPSQLLTVAGGMHLTGALFDRTATSGTNGMVLQTTGAGVQWVATSTLGLGGGSSNWTDNGTYLSTLGTGDGIIVAGSSTIGAGTGATGLTISGNSTTTLNAYIAGTLGIGTTSPSATLALTGSGQSNLFAFASSTGSNLLTLNAGGRLTFGNSTTANILMNGGATSSNPALGLSNVAIGNRAFSYYGSGAQFNIALGEDALYGSSSVPMTGVQNVAIGRQAGYDLTTGNQNVMLGYRAGFRLKTGVENIMLGYQAGQSITSGSTNIIMGSQANISGNGQGNIIFGNNAGRNSDGSTNIFMGYYTGYENRTGTRNIALGHETLWDNRTGSDNIALGYRSGWSLGSNSTTSANIFLGYQAGAGQLSGDNNILLGYNVNVASTTGSNQLSIGNLIYANGLGQGGSMSSGNVSIGTSTPFAKFSIQNNYGSTTALFDVATTTSATYATSSLFRVNADGRVGIGTTTPSQLLTVAGGMHLTGGLFDRTASAGTNGMVLQTTGAGVQWVATSTLGLRDGMSNWTFNGSHLSPSTTVGIGIFASSTIGGGTGATGLTIAGNSTTTLNAYIAGTLGIGTTSPSATLALTGSGQSNLFAFASSTGSTLLSLRGDGRLMFGTTTSANIFLNGGPTSTNPLLSTNTDNIAIGNQAFSYVGSGAVGNIALGYQALYGSSSVPMTGYNNFAAGTSALMNNTTGVYNTAIGYLSLYNNTTGSNNTAFNDKALYNNTTGSQNNAFGYDSLRLNTTGSQNNAFGTDSLRGNTTGGSNNAIGISTLYSNQWGSYNDALGYFALYSNRGSQNVAVGYLAGLNATFATSTTFIGPLTNALSGSISSSTALGVGALLARSNTMVLGGTGANAVDIVTGTSTPWAKLSIMNNYGATTALFDIATTTSATYATSSLFRVNADGRVGIGTTTPSQLLTVAGGMHLTGGLYDRTATSGTNGMVLQTTGAGVQWVATSTLGLRDGMSNWTFNGSRLSPSTTVGIGIFASSTIGGGTGATGLTIAGNSTTTLNAYIAGTLGIGTTSPSAKLSVVGTAGSQNLFAFASSTGSTLLSLTSNGRLVFGTTTSADIIINGGSTTTNQQYNLNNITIGNGAFVSANNAALAQRNIVIGYQAQGTTSSSINGSDNIVLGYQAGYANIGGSNNIILGAQAGYLNGSGVDNIFSGYRAGYLSTGSGNIFSGYRAGDALTSGDRNIVIGYDVDLDNPSTSFGLNIGNIIYGTNVDGTGTTKSTGNIGIGTSTPTSRLTVVGNSSFTNIATFASSTGSTTLALLANGNVELPGQLISAGINWTARNAAKAYVWQSVVYGNGRFVAVGPYNDSFASASDSVMVSVDGINWATTSAAETNQWSSVTYGNGQFVAVAWNGSNRVMTSPDGITWTARAAAAANFWSSVTYGNGLFVAVSPTGSNRIMTSPDGINWTVQSAPIARQWQSVTYGNGLFVAVAPYTDGFVATTSSVMTSPDGITWTARTAGSASGWYSVTHGNGRFVAVANSDSNRVMTSPDGITWTASAVDFNSWSSVTYGNGLFVAVSSDGINRVMTSPDGINWTPRNAVDTPWSSVTYGNGLFVGVGTSGSNRVMTSGFTSRTELAHNNIFQGGTSFMGGLRAGTTSASVGASIFLQGQTGINPFAVASSTGTQLLTITQSGALGLGTSSPEGTGLTIDRSGITGSVIAGMKQYLSFSNSTEGALYYGNANAYVNAPTATSTFIANITRIFDNSGLGNTVRGMEVQAHRGTTTKGENTGLSAFGRTFGVRGTTEGDAGDTFLPAGVFAETRGSTQGNALRAYSGSITTSALVSLFHDSSAFSGTGMLMNFGNGGGSFAATSSAKFIDFQNNGTSKFMVTAGGTTTIGDGTTANMAGLQIGFGGLCVDNDGSCHASTTGRITSVSSATGNSDLAEMYFSADDLLPGDIVMLEGGLSVARAQGAREDRARIVGVVSTKPGLLLGFDDSPLIANESAYPIALKGRVPIRLSTENGPIVKGDRITLSSIPGVGMKATESDTVVGIALEDWNGEYAYTAGFVNQFGDDIARQKVTPHNQNTDLRTQDGCYFGAGNEIGEADCDPLTVKAPKAPKESKEDHLAAVKALATVPAETMVLEGETSVTIGQALMFVQLNNYIVAPEMDMLAALNSTSTLGNSEGETLFDRLKLLAQGFVNGVLTLAEVVADRFTAKEVQTDMLCVGETCIDETTLKALLKAQGEGGSAPAPAPTPEPEPVPEPEPTPEAPLEPEDTEGTNSNGVNPVPELEPVPEPPLEPEAIEETDSNGAEAVSEPDASTEPEVTEETDSSEASPAPEVNIEPAV